MNLRGLLFLILFSCATAAGLAQNSAEVIVYDSTPAGFCAAIGAAREGASVILLEPTQHIGGVNTGGLSLSDSFGCIRESLGGLWREWHERIVADYAARGVQLPYQVNDVNEVKWTYEPHVAMRVTRAMLDEANVTVLTGRYLQSVKKDGARITTLVTKNGSFTGKVFVDASYEGDLMAAAGVSWTIGREGRDEFGESQAGVTHGIKKPRVKVSGFDETGNPLPFITGTKLPPDGTPDDMLQVFSFRLVLTRDPQNRVPMPAPASYDPARWELARRFMAVHPDKVGIDLYELPNGKFDGNDGIHKLLSLGMVGGAQKWCGADEAGRRAIWEEHKQYTLEFYHFLSTDPSVPKKARDTYAALGLCKDEFAEHGHFPPELYVRQGRRMEGEYFMTQNDMDQSPSKEDPVGVSSFPADSHDVTRIALPAGGVITEGAFLRWVQGKRHGYPHQVPYRALIPKRDECANLIVPVAFSCTHVVICSARVEPTWMVLGQSAGVAAAMAAKRGASVQDMPYADLKPRLEAQGQRLVLPDQSKTPPQTATGLIPVTSLPGIVLDDKDAELTGDWAHSTRFKPCIGSGYVISGAKDARGDGKASATFRFKAPKSGEYQVLMAYSAHATRASNVPVLITSGGRETKLTVDQTRPLPAGQNFQRIGTAALNAGVETIITIKNTDTTGFVILDAVQLVPVK
ncbi:MAG TPA: xanthan lyase [Verrucomicrobiales bacterium]|nr:xanthan lyase [Verrucomicrobiales bacterium]HRJ07234.1 FAD-dependent oxidoreductase [Prosthecobacter sp.]HRK14803.1 FAD-dependent oxidoreductase [Prosthecobacter sp.]